MPKRTHAPDAQGAPSTHRKGALIALLLSAAALTCNVAGLLTSRHANAQDTAWGRPPGSSLRFPPGFPGGMRPQDSPDGPPNGSEISPGVQLTEDMIAWLAENYGFHIKICLNGISIAATCEEGSAYSTTGSGQPPTSGIPLDNSLAGGPAQANSLTTLENGAATCCESCEEASLPGTSGNYSQTQTGSATAQAVDYAPASCGAPSSANGARCNGGTCIPGIGNDSGNNGLPEPLFGVPRQFRSRGLAENGSFGPGTSLGYDIRIDMGSDETGAITLHDPGSSITHQFSTHAIQDGYQNVATGSASPYMLTSSTAHQENNTNLTDRWQAVKSLKILKPDGTFAGTRAEAETVVVQNHDGTTFLFEVIRMVQVIPEDNSTTDSSDPGPEPQAEDYATTDEYQIAWNTWYDTYMTWSYEEYYADYYSDGYDTNADTDEYAARLTAITDREGRSLNITYKTWTQEQIDESPERQWQIDTISDSKGQSGTFHYHDQPVGGGWVIRQIDLPDGSHLQYEYTDDKLSRVIHPDGAESTFTTTHNPDTNQIEMVIDDPRATGGSANRRKKLWLTSNFTLTKMQGMEYLNQASLLTTAAINGEQEVTVLNTQIERSPVTSNWGIMSYEGGGVVKATTWSLVAGYMTAWGIQDTTDGTLRLEGDIENTYTNGYTHKGDSWQQGRPEAIIDETGIRRDFGYDQNGTVNRITWGDGSYETAAYNNRGQLTRHRDRTGHVTTYTYDDHGRRLTKETGQLEVQVHEENETANSSNPYQNGYDAGYLAGYDDGYYGLSYADYSNSGSDLYDLGFTAAYDDGWNDGNYDHYEIEMSSSDGAETMYPGTYWQYSYGTSWFDPAEGTSEENDDTSSAAAPTITLQDQPQPEYAVWRWEYYPEESTTAGRLKTAFDPLHDGNSTDTHRTDYEYDIHGNLTKKLGPASVAGGDRPETLYSYDTLNRLISMIDPAGHETTWEYNVLNKHTRTTYDDGTTEEILYGAPGSGNEGMIVATKNRRNIVTEYEYDNAGRRTRIVVATAKDSNILDNNPHDTPITDRNEQSITTYAYLGGTVKTHHRHPRRSTHGLSVRLPRPHH